MSYVNQAHDPRRRATAILGVGGIHAALGIVLVVGLAVDEFPKIAVPRLAGEQIPINPPPEPEPEPVPSAQPSAVPPTAPLPPLSIPNEPTIPVDPFDPTDILRPDVPKTVPTPSQTLRPAPLPSPTPSYTPRAVAPRNGPAGWIETADYPAGPLRRGIEGTVGYRLQIDNNGRVRSCEITRSSGNAQLDQATCRLIERRARFDPATDASGAAVGGGYSGRVTWQIPE